MVPAPLGVTLAASDQTVADLGGRLSAYAWPLVTIPAVQALIRRLGALGDVTHLSTRSTRPAPDPLSAARDPHTGGALLWAGHDQVALSLLIAEVVGWGPPVSVLGSFSTGVTGIDDWAEAVIAFESGHNAAVHVDWRAIVAATQEVQVAGSTGVLRFDTDPTASLEFNGDPVDLGSARPRGDTGTDELTRHLAESGVADMMRVVGASFEAATPMPTAFTLDFGRRVLDVIFAAYRSGRGVGLPAPLPDTGPRDRTTTQLLAHERPH